MERIAVSNLDFDISRITLGTWAIGGFMWAGTDEERSIDTILKAIETGVTTIDTAPVYGFGLSEQIVGKAIRQYGSREKVEIATKAGLQWDENQRNITRNSSARRILQEVEASLDRLQTDYIDIYQIHWPDYQVDFEESASVLKQLYDDGVIRAIGVSNFSAAEMDEFRKTAPIHTCQPPYNLFEREAEENDSVITYCKSNRISLLTYGAICRGLLTGKMRPGQKFPKGDLRRIDPKFSDPERFAAYLETVEELNRYAKEQLDSTVIYLAVRWLLDQGIDSPIWGARRPEQVTFDRVSGWKISRDQMDDIECIVRKRIDRFENPHYMAPPK